MTKEIPCSDANWTCESNNWRLHSFSTGDQPTHSMELLNLKIRESYKLQKKKNHKFFKERITFSVVASEVHPSGMDLNYQAFSHWHGSHFHEQNTRAESKI